MPLGGSTVLAPGYNELGQRTPREQHVAGSSEIQSYDHCTRSGKVDHVNSINPLSAIRCVCERLMK